MAGAQCVFQVECLLKFYNNDGIIFNFIHLFGSCYSFGNLWNLGEILTETSECTVSEKARAHIAIINIINSGVNDNFLVYFYKY